MKRLPDLLLLLLLAIALVQAGLLLSHDGGVTGVTVLLQTASDPPGALQTSGGSEVALKARVAGVADYMTVEDVARGALALQRGELPGVAPLDDDERARLGAILHDAATHRDELLAVEGEIRGLESALRARTAEIARTLTPEQRAWVMARRDQVSIDQVERAYWDELLGAAAAAP